MKKVGAFLIISIIATTLVDVSLPLQNIIATYVIATVAFFLSGFIYYKKIMERPFLNSFLILFFLLSLMSFGYIVNTNAYDKWTLIIVCSLVGYSAGLFSKRSILLNRKKTNSA